LKKIINIKEQLIFKVIVCIVSVWVLGAFLISLIEFDNIGDSLWWTIVTMTTVGYGDMAPESPWGRLLAIFIMLSGIILVAIVTGTISSIFTTKRIMEGKGLEKISKENHLIICGWSPNILSLINGFLDSQTNNDIIMINDESQDKIDSIMSGLNKKNVQFVRGDYSLDSILIKANTTKAKYVLILNDSTHNKDEKVILTTLTIKKISPGIRVIAQINDKNKIPFLRRANVDAVLSSDDYNLFMSLSHVLEPGSAQAISLLMSEDSNNSLKSEEIPDEFIGKTFSELHKYYFDKFETICIGLYNYEEKMGISDLLSANSDSIDRFIERKLKEAGHSLDEKNKVNINLNPNRDEIISKGQGALILK
jgi:voltage-gated potassium channel